MSHRFRQANWLKRNSFAPQVFVFRNMESGQVLYSQLPSFTQYQIDGQFKRPNWENRKPSTRPDIWRIMAVASFPSFYSATKAYNALINLRHMRDVSKKAEAMKYRPRNEDNHIWYSAQYRPIYTQEAVADISTVIDHVDTKTVLHWEDEWRKGDLKHWNSELVQHELLDRAGLRVPNAVLNDMRLKGLEIAKVNSIAEKVKFGAKIKAKEDARAAHIAIHGPPKLPTNAKNTDKKKGSKSRAANAVKSVIKSGKGKAKNVTSKSKSKSKTSSSSSSSAVPPPTQTSADQLGQSN